MDPKESSCSICFESLNDKTVGSPNICDHKFCLSCLMEWTKHGNFCPVDRQRFKKIISGNEVIRVKHKRKKKDSELYDISVFCEICKDTKENNDTLILCDCCDLGFHFVCLEPPLKSVPRGSWYCSDCLKISKKLEAKKKKKQSNDPPVPSKQSSYLLPRQFAAPCTKSRNPLRKGNGVCNSVCQNTNKMFTNNEKSSKESHVSEKDYYKKKFPQNKTANVPFNCAGTPSGEFEDFFNISNNVVILTNRKLLRTEEKSLNKNIGGKCETNSSVELKMQQLAKNVECNNFRMQQTEEKTKRLAATIARRKIIQEFKNVNIDYSDEDSSSSSQCSSDVMEKDILFGQTSLLSCNKSAVNYMDKCSFSQPKSMNQILSYQKSKGEFLSSESENANLDSESSCSKNTKKINIAMKDSNSSSSKSVNICLNLVKSTTAKMSNCVIESSDKSHSMLNLINCKSFSTCTKINDSVAEELNSAQIPMALESLSVSEKHEEPPELETESLNSEIGIPPELPMPSLTPIKSSETQMYSIAEAETKQDHSVLEDLNCAKNGSSETFSVFEKITNSTEIYSSRNGLKPTEETHRHMEDWQSAENLENDKSPQEKDNYHVDEIQAEENILNNFHMRQIHYAIKARINLPAELQKIEKEAWLSHRSKSSKKYKYKSLHTKAKICTSYDQVFSSKEQHQLFFNDTPHVNNETTHSKQGLNNKFNPFCQSVCGSPPKKLFKVTEYNFQPYDKQVLSKNVLRDIMDPYSLKHLDVREDGSLFLNWNKSSYVSSF